MWNDVKKFNFDDFRDLLQRDIKRRLNFNESKSKILMLFWVLRALMIANLIAFLIAFLNDNSILSDWPVISDLQWN